MSKDPLADSPSPTAVHGRLLIVIAAVLWSTSGAFTKVLTKDTPLGLNSPTVAPLLIAAARLLFGATILIPTLRRRDVSFRPSFLLMMSCFAVMNVTFVWALAAGTAANAIVLQYTAPAWMFLASVWLLGEKADWRSLVVVVVSLIGIGVIVAGGWRGGNLLVIGIASLSGLMYAGVILGLRVNRQASSGWLIVLNQLFGGVVLLPFIYDQALPTPGQLAVLFLYGAGQMAIPYWLMARSLKSVSPQEAGTIGLLEPLLNPIWTYWISGEVPSLWTCVGGSFIIGALAWRYWPTKNDDRVG